MRSILVFLFTLFTPLAYALNLVATTASMGMLAREVGGAAVTVSVLAPPDRDPHKLQAKPSMMRALRDADLVVAVGAELEAGWVPAAIKGAANPQILPGRVGFFEAAAQVPLLDSGQAADRARGDVHPMGNPHMHLDPERMATFALVFVPPWVAHRHASSWRTAMFGSAAIAAAAYFLAFWLALVLDQPFGPVLVALLVLALLPVRIRRRGAARGATP